MPRGWASCYVECWTGLAGSWVASSGGSRSLEGPRAPCSLCCMLGTPPAFLSHCQPPRAGQRACWGPPGSQLRGGATACCGSSRNDPQPPRSGQVRLGPSLRSPAESWQPDCRLLASQGLHSDPLTEALTLATWDAAWFGDTQLPGEGGPCT